jgi:hypothetical protein
MKISTTNILPQLKKQMKEKWELFSFTPSRYWNVSLIIFAVMLLLILLLNAVFFWRFVLTLQPEYNESAAEHLTLERKSLETALSLLNFRQERFTTIQQNFVPIKNIFRLPPPENTE